MSTPTQLDQLKQFTIVVADTDYGENVVRENLMWGTRGKDGTSPLRYVALKDMDTRNIEAILRNNDRLDAFRRRAMEHELHLRETQGTKA